MLPQKAMNHFTQFRIMCLICLISLCFGCSRESMVCFFNNQNVGVEVLTENETLLVNPKESLTFSFSRVARGFVIKNINGEFSYEFQPVPIAKNRLLWKRKNSKHMITIQLEPNQMIYVVSPDSALPSNNFPVQPDGFPLNPRIK